MEKESALMKELISVKQNLEERQKQHEEEQRNLEEKHQKEVSEDCDSHWGECPFKKKKKHLSLRDKKIAHSSLFGHTPPNFKKILPPHTSDYQKISRTIMKM